MTDNTTDRVPLNNGYSIPVIGLGTYQLNGQLAKDVIYEAIQIGYRLFDSASMYGNEAEVGTGIRRAIQDGTPREELFVVTKVWHTDMGYKRTMKAFEKSFDALNIGYVDLLLIHWPGRSHEENLSTWKALEEIYESKKVKAIGVSNFDEKDLKYLLQKGKITPAVNQYEIHPGHAQEMLYDFCEEQGIVSMAYSPIHKGRVANDSRVKKLADQYGKTPAQIALRWHIQRGVIPVPKTSNIERLGENAAVFDFELSEEDMHLLRALG